jgi:hypothetical protein
MSGLPVSTPRAAPFFKTNWNVLYASCGLECSQGMDALLAGGDATKPVVYTTPGGLCNDTMVPLAMIARIRSSPVPVFGVVDNRLSWWEMLPVLFCHRRYMYENAELDSSMAYTFAWGNRLKDIVHNAEVFRALIVDVVRSRARPTPELLRDMFDRTMTLSAHDCLRLGLVDEVIPLSAAGGTSAPRKKMKKGRLGGATNP